jgi:hypothetical protein
MNRRLRCCRRRSFDLPKRRPVPELRLLAGGDRDSRLLLGTFRLRPAMRVDSRSGRISLATIGRPLDSSGWRQISGGFRSTCTGRRSSVLFERAADQALPT